ncbi:hypothetical protein H102_08869 [Trichophyton rubrum CBS 100081]|nr:hypothetical protein H102_08869 [Trichophyton rubrum CBS 100081]
MGTRGASVSAFRGKLSFSISPGMLWNRFYLKATTVTDSASGPASPPSTRQDGYVFLFQLCTLLLLCRGLASVMVDGFPRYEHLLRGRYDSDRRTERSSSDRQMA